MAADTEIVDGLLRLNLGSRKPCLPRVVVMVLLERPRIGVLILVVVVLVVSGAVAASTGGL